jgi:D-aminoacyl-tRNA deacylase
MILIVASNKDVASQNIAGRILDHYPFEKTTTEFQHNRIYELSLKGEKIKLATLNEESVYAQNLVSSFVDVELVVFVSRHSSLTGTPTLSVHTPGNLGGAELGGLARSVSVSPANAMRDALKAMMRLKNEMQLNYEVSYESTHHGPSLDVPTMFTELGSTPEQWKDKRAAEAIAHATMEAVSNFGSFPAKAVLGIGGPHYHSKFTRIALEKETAFGHMIPKHAVPSVDLEIMRQCLRRTLEKVEAVILDWKGIKGEHKPKVTETLRKLGVPFEKA